MVVLDRITVMSEIEAKYFLVKSVNFIPIYLRVSHYLYSCGTCPIHIEIAYYHYFGPTFRRVSACMPIQTPDTLALRFCFHPRLNNYLMGLMD